MDTAQRPPIFKRMKLARRRGRFLRNGGVREATMKKIMLIAAGLALLASEAQAISRYNSTSMTCDWIKATIRQQGAVLLRWRGNSGIPRYGRFVQDGRFCESGTRAEISYVPASDRKSCLVRECKYWDPDDEFIWRRN